jgi:hypothetical protein
MAKTKAKQRERIDDSYEAPKETPRGVVKTLKADVVDGFKHDILEQFFGKSESGSKKSGEMVQGQEISFKKEEARQNASKVETRVQRVEAGIDYARQVINSEKIIRSEGNQVLATRIEEIVIELKHLTRESKALETQFRDITTVVMPRTPGKYHQNFFEWMLTVVRSARMRVENAEQWLKVVSGKGKKKDYWGMFKKHGTSFGLSSERVVAQQTG